MQFIAKTVTFIALALVMVACSTSINLEDGDVVINSSFSLTETMLNSGETEALSFGNVEFIQNTVFDIQDGQIVASGDVLCADDSRENGSVAFMIEATEDGFILAEIGEVSADCEIDSSIIQEAQEELASSLAEAARELEESDASLTFTEVTLADDTMTLAIEVRAPLNSGE